jgi:hypothetical protein
MRGYKFPDCAKAQSPFFPSKGVFRSCESEGCGRPNCDDCRPVVMHLQLTRYYCPPPSLPPPPHTIPGLNSTRLQDITFQKTVIFKNHSLQQTQRTLQIISEGNNSCSVIVRYFTMLTVMLKF